MQEPGGPTEDTSGNVIFTEQMGKSFDLLLGRKTFEIFASYWPQHEDEWPGVNKATKYVVSNTLAKHEWSNSVFLKGNVVDEIKKLKGQDGLDLQVHGSAEFIQTLLKHDLVDEFWLKIFPVTLGTGKRLFAQGTIPAAYTLVDSKTSPSGVIISALKRAGDVKTGSF